MSFEVLLTERSRIQRRKNVYVSSELGLGSGPSIDTSTSLLSEVSS